MSRQALLAGAAVAVVISAGIAVADTAGAASTGASAKPPTQPKVMKLRSTRLSLTNPSKSTFVAARTLSRAGKKLGYETESCDDGGTKVRCAVTFSLSHGVLLGHFTAPISTSNTSTAAGKITGGLGTYAGDQGTVHASFHGKHARFTLTFHS